MDAEENEGKADSNERDNVMYVLMAAAVNMWEKETIHLSEWYFKLMQE